VSGQLVFLVAIGALFYFMLIDPQRRKARAQQELTAKLAPGVEIMTTAGLFATVRAINDDDVLLEVAPGVVQRYAKGAVLRVITPDEPEADEPQAIEPGAEGTSSDDHTSSEDGSGDPPAAPRES